MADLNPEQGVSVGVALEVCGHLTPSSSTPITLAGTLLASSRWITPDTSAAPLANDCSVTSANTLIGDF